MDMTALKRSASFTQEPVAAVCGGEYHISVSVKFFTVVHTQNESFEPSLCLSSLICRDFLKDDVCFN